MRANDARNSSVIDEHCLVSLLGLYHWFSFRRPACGELDGDQIKACYDAFREAMSKYTMTELALDCGQFNCPINCENFRGIMEAAYDCRNDISESLVDKDLLASARQLNADALMIGTPLLVAAYVFAATSSLFLYLLYRNKGPEEPSPRVPLATIVLPGETATESPPADLDSTSHL